MKKTSASLSDIAQAAIISIAFLCLNSAAWAATSEPFVRYTVQSQDTLQGLTRSLLNDPAQWPAVAKLNGLKNPNRIHPGQTIDVPKSLLNFKKQPALPMPGKVISAQGDARVQGVAAAPGAAVPEGAALQTGANSSLLVELGDGSRVQLMPRSLATVITQRAYQLRDPASSASTNWFSGAIRLVEGVIDTLADKRANRATPLEVTTPTSQVGIRGTQFRVAYEDPASGVARTEVLEGKVVTANTLQKVSADIAGGFGAALKPNEREIKVVALLPALPESSLASQVQRTTDGASAVWQVGSLAGASAYRAQIATDAAFEKLQSDIKSASPSINLASVANGSYYARVRGIDPAGIEGFNAVRQIEIKNTPVALMWPASIANNAVAQFGSAGLLLRLQTKSSDTPEQLTLQIAQDANLTQGLQTIAVAADKTALVPGLQPGNRYYVRIIDAKIGLAASSPVMVLDVPGNWGSTVYALAHALQLQR